MARLANIRSPLGTLAPLLKAPPKIADSFYLSPEWRTLVAEIKRERGGWCEECGSKHRVMGDHIKELKDGGEPLDKTNVKLRCIRCHNRKTHSERGKRARGQV